MEEKLSEKSFFSEGGKGKGRNSSDVFWNKEKPPMQAAFKRLSEFECIVMDDREANCLN